MWKGTLIGTTAGMLFSIWDTIVSYADTAPIDVSPGMEIITWPIFVKTIVYMVIGGVAGWLIFFVIRKVSGKFVN